ncbi:MAG: hypothetical protein ACJ786_29900 [Catenulispora sp.]
MIRRSLVALAIAAAAFAAQIPTGQAAQRPLRQVAVPAAAHPAPYLLWCYDSYYGWYLCL